MTGTLYPQRFVGSDDLDLIELGDRVIGALIADRVYGPMPDEDYREAVEDRRAEYLGTAEGCPVTIDPWR